eukprot:m.26983 g.26983  ORF g.26983 m.26983 type:complete len:847 (-) comp15631_c0_seq1:111-2651(-)
MSTASTGTVFRLAPFTYIQVLDATTNITMVELGPQTFIRQDNQKVVFGPAKMVTIPPRHYALIKNPVARDDKGELIYEGKYKQLKLRHAEEEIRLAQEPFPLYPGEELVGGIQQLIMVAPDAAIRVKAKQDFDDGKVKRVAGDEWLFKGPATFTPHVMVQVVETILATIIGPNQALRMRARKDIEDHKGKARVTGEEWLVTSNGAYLPGVYEDVVGVVNALVLTDKQAIQLRATKTYMDCYDIARKNGDEWLVTCDMAETHMPDIYEEVVKTVRITTLSNRDYAVIVDPCDDKGRPQLGQLKLVTGPVSFFLNPGESLREGIQPFYVLSEDEGLIIKATEAFEDTSTGAKEARQPGDRWMIKGPTEYVPGVQVEVVERRKAMPLDDNEGVYVRNTQTGKVRAVIGETYMLDENECLWEKIMSEEEESLLLAEGAKGPHLVKGRNSEQSRSTRVKSKVVSFRVPHNGCVQIYDYKAKKARVMFGPDLVMLGPDEKFTTLSLSGGKPKKPNQIKCLCLLLGPDFCTDVITIETADHARLQLQLSYNWKFDLKELKNEDSSKIFSVSDFVGDLCKAVASRVRGAVAGVQFDDFHKNSARIIRQSVFGLDENNKIRGEFKFPANCLVVTSVDIQNVEPVDQRTRDALQKSVQLAIEITTNSQEATATHEAQRLEQEAKGRLERQKLKDQAEAEKSRGELLSLQADSNAVESTGQAVAEAQSRAKANQIEGEAKVSAANLTAQASTIEAESELARLKAAREAELVYIKAQNDLEVDKLTKLAEIEKQKFAAMVTAIGQDTLRAIAVAGPEMQVKLLQGLGIQSTLITDGKSPINLFNTAAGLLGQSSQSDA